MGKIIEERVRDLRRRQMAGEPMRCPSCGMVDLETPMEKNPISRYIGNLRFCKNCARREAECADTKNVVLDDVRTWAFLRDNIMPDCFIDDPPEVAEWKIERNLISKLCDLFKQWVKGIIVDDDFEMLVITTIPGVYSVETKSAVTVTFNTRDDSVVHVWLQISGIDGVEYAIDHTDFSE